ncbi:NAD(P)-dependent oxidoreductase [bacterium]|nr:NAD(P)-dependent oxidoreductase [bacterium]
MTKTVLVTGAGGFIGLNTVKEFVNAGWHVFALVHRNIPDELKNLKNVEIIQGDVTKEEFVSGLNLDVDVVAHIAGLASDIGSDNVFRKINFEPIKYLSKIPKNKIVYVSSSDVYGIKDFENADENTPLCEYPKNPYPRYKIMSENWLKENCEHYVIIRPAAVWGEGDKTLENRFIDFLKTSPFIVHFGKWKGANRWPLANVKNVAKTIVAVSEFSDFDNQAITIIDPEKTTIDEYYRQLAEKYFPQKTFKSITLPMWIGKLIGFISTSLSYISKDLVFDPTFYAVHHVSSNLDFSSDKMLKVLKKYSTI